MIINTEQTVTYKSIVSLEQYGALVGYSECAMFGVFSPESRTYDECRDVWTLPQRNYVARYFAEAQQEIEDYIERLLMPTWISGNLYETGNTRLTDVQNCKRAYSTKWQNLIAMGRQFVVTLELDATIDHTNDPAIIGPISYDPTIVTDFNFVKIYYPDTNIEINPMLIYNIGTNLYIEVPRCRLLRYDLRNNPTNGYNYTVIENFQETVDVVYDAVDPTDSIVDFGDGTVGLWYLAGEIKPTIQQVEMVMRLAHSKMPDEPCGCEISQRLWKRDRNVPEIMTAERLQCPFGLSDGAWIAYKWAQAIKGLKLGHI